MNKIKDFVSKLNLKQVKFLYAENLEEIEIKRVLKEFSSSENLFFNLIVLEEKVENIESLFYKKVSYDRSLLEAAVLDKLFKNNNQINDYLEKSLKSYNLTPDDYSYYKIMDNVLIPKLKREYLKEVYCEVLHREAVFALTDKLDSNTLPKKYVKLVKNIEDISKAKEDKMVNDYFNDYPDFKKEIEDLITKPQKRVSYYRNYNKQVPALAPILQGDFRGEGQWYFIQAKDSCKVFRKDKYSKQDSMFYNLVFARLQAQGVKIETLVVAFNSKGEVFSFKFPELVFLKSLIGRYGQIPEQHKQELGLVKTISSLKDLSWDYFMTEGKILPTYEK